MAAIKKLASELVSEFVPACNTLATLGFHLTDLDAIRTAVYGAVKLFAQDKTSASTFPDRLICSHCGDVHELTPDAVNDALFKGPGAVDFAATYNELFGILKGEPADDTTHDFGVTSDVQIASVLDGTTPLAVLPLPGGQVPQDPAQPVLEGTEPQGRHAGAPETPVVDLTPEEQATIDLIAKDAANGSPESTTTPIDDGNAPPVESGQL